MELRFGALLVWMVEGKRIPVLNIAPIWFGEETMSRCTDVQKPRYLPLGQRRKEREVFGPAETRQGGPQTHATDVG